MPWLGKDAPENERSFAAAAHGLNQALDRRVRLSIQLRVTSCARNAISLAPLLRRELAEEKARHEAHSKAMEEWAKTDHTRAPTVDWDSQGSYQYAAVLQAMYNYVRSTQDAVYAALIEASGHRAGSYTSMYNCAKNPSAPYHADITSSLPGYFEWFRDLRDLRNQMKLGISFGFHIHGTNPVREVGLLIHTVNDGERSTSAGRELPFTHVSECLGQTTRLFNWAAASVRTGP